MKKAITSAVIITILLITIAGAFALVAGPFTHDEAVAASKDPVFYNELGYHLAQEGKNDAAQDAFAAAVTLDPKYENARKNLATIAFQNGDYETAIAQGRALVAAHPENQNYRFDLAQSLVAQARFVDADLAKLEEAAAIFEGLGSFPHAQENAAIVRAVLVDAS